MIIVDHCHNVYLSVALSACLAINPFTTLATKRIQVCKRAGQADGSLMWVEVKLVGTLLE